MPSDEVTISVITAFVTLAGTVFTLLQVYLIAKLNSVKKVADDIHTLTNSNFGAQLQISLVALKRILVLTKEKEPVDPQAVKEALLAVKEAEDLLEVHRRQQIAVDNRK